MKNALKVFLTSLFVVLVTFGFKQKQKPKQIRRFGDITKPEAHTMVHDFTSNPITRPVFHGRPGQTETIANTKCVWFDINRLDSIVKQVKNEKGDGIRIYFAKYNNNHQQTGSHGRTLDYSLLNTLVLISTKDSTDNNNVHHHYDYYDYIGVPFKKDKSSKKIHGILILPQNKGELCPPGDCVGADL